MKLDEAIEDVEIAFRQVEFSIRLLTYCEHKKIDPAEFDDDHLVILGNGQSLRFPSGNFGDTNSLIKAAETAFLIAFSASVLALDKALEVSGIRSDPEAIDNCVCLRTLIYMVRCAQAHGIAEPRWEVRGAYLRPLTVSLRDSTISLDLPQLNGQLFSIDDLGGYGNWYRVRDLALECLRVAS